MLNGHLRFPRPLAVEAEIVGRGRQVDQRSHSFESAGQRPGIGEVANDLDAIEAALRRAMAVDDAPSLIILRSHIGWPSPKYTDTEFAPVSY